MNEEEMITTYKEFEEAIKNGERKLVKGLGRLQAYEGLEYIKELLENDKYYCEELEDSFVAISSYIDNKEKEKKQLQNNWNELKKWLEDNQKDATWSDIFIKIILEKMQELEGNNG